MNLKPEIVEFCENPKAGDSQGIAPNGFKMTVLSVNHGMVKYEWESDGIKPVRKEKSLNEWKADGLLFFSYFPRFFTPAATATG